MKYKDAFEECEEELRICRLYMQDMSYLNDSLKAQVSLLTDIISNALKNH